MSGLLGKADLAPETPTALYTVPADTVASLTLALCNTGAATCNVRAAIGTGTEPGAGDFIEYDTRLPACGVLERTALTLSPGETLWASASAAGVNARAHGFEETL